MIAPPLATLKAANLSEDEPALSVRTSLVNVLLRGIGDHRRNAEDEAVAPAAGSLDHRTLRDPRPRLKLGTGHGPDMGLEILS